MEYGTGIIEEAFCRIPRVGIRATIKMLPFICKRVLDEDIYRAYVAESLFAHGKSQRLTEQYITLISERKKPDMRTPEQIKADIVERAGLVLI